VDLSWGLYVPLILAGVAFGLLSIVAGVVAGRGNAERAERLRDVGFLVLMAMGVWTLVLLLMAIISEPDDVWDMVIITIVIAAFFAILLVVFFAISVAFGGASRMSSRRKRVTTDEL
jgi:hypothetical protein